MQISIVFMLDSVPFVLKLKKKMVQEKYLVNFVKKNQIHFSINLRALALIPSSNF